MMMDSTASSNHSYVQLSVARLLYQLGTYTVLPELSIDETLDIRLPLHEIFE